LSLCGFSTLGISGDIKADWRDDQQGIDWLGVVDGLLGDEGKDDEQDDADNQNVFFAAGESHVK